MQIIWKGSPNYSTGRPAPPQFISLHIMAGYLAGTDSTFAKASVKASAHYGIGANGTVHQYVKESDTAWADGAGRNNWQSISIEHEGGISAARNTDECVSASAQLCAAIANRYGWKTLIHGQNVKLHREIPPYTHPACPDKCPNPLRWQEIITQANNILTAKPTLTTKSKEPDMAEMIFNNTDDGKMYYWNILSGAKYIGSIDQINLLKAAGVPVHDTSAKASWMTAAQQMTDSTLSELRATQAAQSAAISALAQATGANPDTIAGIVADAVKTKLDNLTITINEK